METTFVVTIPINTTQIMQDNHKQGVELLKETIDNGFHVTHITSCAIDNNMFVYHFLEKD